MDNFQNDIIDVRTAQEIAKVSRNTLLLWIRQEKFEAKKFGNTYIIYKPDFLRFLKEREEYYKNRKPTGPKK